MNFALPYGKSTQSLHPWPHEYSQHWYLPSPRYQAYPQHPAMIVWNRVGVLAPWEHQLPAEISSPPARSSNKPACLRLNTHWTPHSPDPYEHRFRANQIDLELSHLRKWGHAPRHLTCIPVHSWDPARSFYYFVVCDGCCHEFQKRLLLFLLSVSGFCVRKAVVFKYFQALLPFSRRKLTKTLQEFGWVSLEE